MHFMPYPVTFYNLPEVTIDAISDVAVGDVGLGVSVIFGASRSKHS